MKHFLLIALLAGLLGVHSAHAQTNACEHVFDDANAYTAEFFDRTLAQIDNGVIPWESTDWEGLVLRVVASSEFYLNHCTNANSPLSEQPDTVDALAAQSQILPPVESVDVGGDFGTVTLAANYTPSTQFADLNGDGADELILHTQVPYFSDATVYGIRGGLSIAFFLTEDGWQGQVITPVTEFVTTQEGPHLTYAQIDTNSLSVTAADQALNVLPGPQVEVVEAADGTPLTFVTESFVTPAGEAKELDVITWDGRIPSVALRVSFDDWCYPGQPLTWEIGADGSVFVPSNGNEEGSPLHCGRTPEARYEWADGAYTLAS
ncbi:MAG: hypothetical protein U0452_16375 [Anaerolineae bacterium]